MSAGNRKLSTFRLTDECRRLLADLAERRGVSQAAIIELLVRDEAHKQAERELKVAA
jgi:predicted transcriptional regulator